MDKSHVKNQHPRIILVLDLKALKFNNFFNYKFFLKFNPMMGKYSISIKLDTVTEHGVIRVK